MEVETLKISTGQGTELDLPIAGLGVRSYAFIIDWHIRLVLAMAWIFLWIFFLEDSIFDSISSLIYNLSTTSNYIIFIPAFIIYFFYHPVLEIMMQGRTPGKRMAKIRIVTSEGHLPGIGAHLIRNIFRLIDNLPSLYCFGIVACLLNKHQLRSGDLAANTVLVYEENIKGSAMQDVEHFLSQGKLPLEQLQTIRDLIQRWNGLDGDIRMSLAKKLFAKTTIESEDFSALSDSELLAKLNELVHI